MSKHPDFRRAVFSKIRHKSKKTLLEFTIDLDSYVFTCEDPLHADFRRAFDDLGGDVAALCEVNRAADWQEHNPVLPYQVSIKRKDDSRSFKIVAARALKNHHEQLTLNAPLMYDDAPSPEKCLNESVVDKLDHLIEEARLYLGGKRGQLDMFAGEAGKAADLSGNGQLEKIFDSGKARPPLNQSMIRTGGRLEEGEAAHAPSFAAEAEAPDADAQGNAERLAYRYGDDPPDPQDIDARLDYYEDICTSLEQMDLGVTDPEQFVAMVIEVQALFRSWRDTYSPSLDGKQFNRTQEIARRLAALKADSGLAEDVEEKAAEAVE